MNRNSISPEAPPNNNHSEALPPDPHREIKEIDKMSRKSAKSSKSKLVANPKLPSEFVKAAIKMKDVGLSKRSENEAKSGALAALGKLTATISPEEDDRGLETIKGILNDDIIGELLGNKAAKNSLGEDVVRDLVASQKLNEAPKDSTIKAIIQNDHAKEILGESKVQKIIQVKEHKDKHSKRKSSRSKSKGKLDHRNPEFQYRNIEGVRPVDNYYSKLYKSSSSKKTASMLYKSKASTSSLA